MAESKREKITVIDYYPLFDVPIEDSIKFLQNLKDEHEENGWKNISMELNYGLGYYDSIEIDIEIYGNKK